MGEEVCRRRKHGHSAASSGVLERHSRGDSGRDASSTGVPQGHSEPRLRDGASDMLLCREVPSLPASGRLVVSNIKQIRLHGVSRARLPATCRVHVAPFPAFYTSSQSIIISLIVFAYCKNWRCRKPGNEARVHVCYVWGQKIRHVLIIMLTCSIEQYSHLICLWCKCLSVVFVTAECVFSPWLA